MHGMNNTKGGNFPLRSRPSTLPSNRCRTLLSREFEDGGTKLTVHLHLHPHHGKVSQINSLHISLEPTPLTLSSIRPRHAFVNRNNMMTFATDVSVVMLTCARGVEGNAM